MIPEDTDILITHGPPEGILDLCKNGDRVGCRDLLLMIEKPKPKVHVLGHIHESYGIKVGNGTTFINACNLDERYKLRYKPITLEAS